MSNTLARRRIEKGLDIANGCDLGVTINELHVGKVSMILDTINVAGKAFPYKEACIESNFSVKFVFSAGYYIQASYWFRIKTELKDMISLESQINAVQNLHGTFGVEKDLSNSIPFNNWFLVTKDAELLKEIESVNFSDDDSEPTHYHMKTGDVIFFDDYWACSDVAYGLLMNIDVSKKPKPYPETGFTKEVVKAFDKQVRDAICDVLKKSHEASLDQTGE